jgi:hypothetical protein
MDRPMAPSPWGLPQGHDWARALARTLGQAAVRRRKKFYRALTVCVI